MNASPPLTEPHSPRHALGIDVGGTKIAGGIVDLVTGRVTGRRQIATACDRGGAPVLADVAEMARALCAEAARLGLQPDALGLGVAELVDRHGRVFSDYRIKWADIDVAAALKPILPTLVSSDVRAAALAEARFGAGRGLGDFYFVTIGTGVSGVLVQNGIPYAGSRGAALVIGNGQSRHHCPECGHVSTRVVEDVASGLGLVAAYGRGGRAEDVLAAAARGDHDAARVIAHATGELGRVLALLADSLDPQAIIIGGGLGSEPGRYFDSLTRAIRAGLWQDHGLPIIQAALGQDAGLIGAAAATSQQPEPVDRPLHAT